MMILAMAARAGDIRLQIFELDEQIGLAAQLVGHHRRRGADGRDHRNPHAPAEAQN